MAPHVSREHIEVYRFSLPVAIGVPLLAIFFQAFVPVRFPFFSYFDLPLLVTIYFAVARHSQVSGLLTGGLIGLAQDSLTHHPLGLYGIAKTVVGYVASSVGARIDTEHPASRFALVFLFFHFHQAVLAVTKRVLLDQPAQQAPFITLHLLFDSLVSAACAVVLFALLDRLRRSS